MNSTVSFAPKALAGRQPTVAGPTFPIEGMENVYSATLKNKIRYFQVYTDSDGMPHREGAEPALMTMDDKGTYHEEHHLHGKLHNWHGPALIHGSQAEYWLYGARFSVSDHRRLSLQLALNAADAVFDQWYSHPNYNAVSFIEYLTRIKEMNRGVPVITAAPRVLTIQN